MCLAEGMFSRVARSGPTGTIRRTARRYIRARVLLCFSDDDPSGPGIKYTAWVEGDNRVLGVVPAALVASTAPAGAGDHHHDDEGLLWGCWWSEGSYWSCSEPSLRHS